jgi:hydrogenase maturation protease
VTAVTEWAAVVGVGNPFRRDDGAGQAVVDALAADPPPEVRLVCCDGDPVRLMDAWDGVRLAVVVDAAAGGDRPGRVHLNCFDRLPGGGVVTSSHGMGLPEAVELADALDRLPERLAVVTVEAAETGFGIGLSGPVAAALPALVAAVRAELRAGE